jgi:N-terminal glutamine amidase
LIQNESLFLLQYALNSACKNNLQQFIEMNNSEDGFGRVLQEHEFLDFCQNVESKEREWVWKNENNASIESILS